MSASESDLKLKIAADSSAVKSGLTPGMQAVSDLRTHVGNELSQITKLSDKALGAISEHLNLLVRERIPVGGGLFVNLTDNLKGLIEPAKSAEGSILKLDSLIDSLSQKSGIGAKEIANFLVPFSKLESQAQKDAAAVEFFGKAVQGPLVNAAQAGQKTAQELSGTLAQAANEAKLLGSASESAAGGLFGLGAAAGPVGLALAVGVAETALLVISLYELTKVSVDAAENYASYGEELGKAAIQTGLTVEQLHGLKLLAEENKVSFEGLTLGFGRYLRAVIEAQQGNKQFGEEFERLGIDVTKLGNDPQAAIQALVAAFNRLGPSMLTNQAAIALLGREGVRVVGALIAAGASLDEITAKAQQYSKFTGEDAKAAKAFGEEVAATKFAIEGYNLELGRTVEPIVLEFQKELLKLLIDNKEVIGDVIKAFGLFIQANGAALLAAVRGTTEVVHELTGAWKELKIAAEAATIIGIPQALRDSQALYEQEKSRYEPKPETAEDAARRKLTPVASTIPSNELTRFAGLAPPPTPPTPETQDVTSLRLKKSLEDLKKAADELAVSTAAAIAQTETKIKEGNVAWAEGTKTIEANLKAATQAQLNYLAEQKRQLEEQKKAAVTPTDAFKVQQEINKVDQSILAAQTKFQTDYSAKETALRDHLRAEKIRGLEANAKIEKDAIERTYAARENQGKLSAEAELAATEARNKAIFGIDRQALANEISLYPKQAAARQELERKLTELESKRTSEILNQENERLKIQRDAASQRERISQTSADSDLRIARIRGDEEIAELKDRLTRSGDVVDAARAKRIKGIDDEIAKQRTLLNQLQPTIEDTGVVGRFNSIIAKIQQLQAARDAEVGAEEKAAERISKIRVDLINKELATERAKLAGLKALNLTPVEYETQQKALNAKIAELEEQRTAALKEGARAQADARQKDIDDLRAYEDEYSKLVLSGLRLDQEVARLQLQILIASRADARTILNAEIADETAREDRQHSQELGRIDAERDAALKKIRGLQDENEKKKEIQIQYDLDLEKEKTRHDAALGLTDAKQKQGELDLQKHDPFQDLQKAADSIDRTLHPEKFALAQAGVQALSGAFESLGQAVGQAVNAFVLYGSAGTSVRKVTAEILASIAQQAAVQAIYELAQGLAVLALAFFGVPNAGPSASAHFAAAAMYGVVAGVSALAGRAIAGNAFQSGAGGASSGSSSSTSSLGNANQQNTPATIKEEWVQRRPIIIQLHGDASQFDWKVINALHDDVSKNGRARGLIIDTSKKG